MGNDNHFNKMIYLRENEAFSNIIKCIKHVDENKATSLDIRIKLAGYCIIDNQQ